MESPSRRAKAPSAALCAVLVHVLVALDACSYTFVRVSHSRSLLVMLPAAGFGHAGSTVQPAAAPNAADGAFARRLGDSIHCSRPLKEATFFSIAASCASARNNRASSGAMLVANDLAKYFF